MSRPKDTVYSVWATENDELLAFELPAEKCADVLGMTYSSFRTIVSKGSPKYYFEKRKISRVDKTNNK